MIGQFANIQNALNTNRLFPGQLQRAAAGNTGGAISLAHHKYQATAAAMLPLLQTAPPGTITHDQLTTALAGAEAGGMITQPFMARLLAQAPQGDGPGFDAAVRAAVASGSQTDAGAALSTVTPSAGPMVSTGQGQFGTTLAPRGAPNAGQLTPAGIQAPEFPATSTNMQQVTWVDASRGQQHQSTAGSFQRAIALGIPPDRSGRPVPAGQESAQPGAAGAGRRRGHRGPCRSAGSAGVSARTRREALPGPMPGTPEALSASAMSSHVANRAARPLSPAICSNTQAQGRT